MRASEILGEEDFEIRVDLGGQGVGGKEEARYWTCDFSYVSGSVLLVSDMGMLMMLVCRSTCRSTVIIGAEGGLGAALV